MLQFGHGGEAVETMSEEVHNERHKERFNSATAVKPWRQNLSDLTTGPSFRFNSATAVKPWRRHMYSALSRMVNDASIRPRR